MFERKDILKLKKDIILDVNLLDSDLRLHTRWGLFSPRAIDDGTMLLMNYLSLLLSNQTLQYFHSSLQY